MVYDAAPVTAPQGRLLIRSPQAHVGLAVVSALMLMLAFPMPGWGWLAHIALVPVTILALRSDRPGMCFLCIYVVSLLWWLLMLRWLMPVTVFGTIGACLYLALYLPVSMMLVRRVARCYRCAMVLLLPAVWTSLELIRGWWLAGGFGWFAISHTQAPFDPSHGPGRLMQFADLLGEHGVTFLVLMTNGWLIDLLTRPWVRTDKSGMKRRSPVVVASTLIWAVTMAAAWSYGQYRITQTSDTPRTVNVAVVQTNVPQDNKERGTIAQTTEDWATLLRLTGEAARLEPAPDLIVWPETVVPAPLNREAVELAMDEAMHWASMTVEDMRASGRVEVYERVAADMEIRLEDLPANMHEHYALAASVRDHVRRMAMALQRPILIGAPTRILGGGGERFNSSYLVYADGQFDPQRYDKIHRVPFGEYVPWVERVDFLHRLFIRYLTPYDTSYSLTAGRGPVVFEVPIEAVDEAGATSIWHLRATPAICFEDTVPRVTRWMVYGRSGRKQADLMVNQSNDGWFAGTAQGPQHVQIASYRCVETRTPMVRSVNTGVSGMIDSVGRVTAAVEVDGQKQQVAGAVSGVVTLDERSTLFGRWGHVPMLMLLAGTTALVGVSLFGRRRSIRGTTMPGRMR